MPPEASEESKEATPVFPAEFPGSFPVPFGFSGQTEVCPEAAEEPKDAPAEVSVPFPEPWDSTRFEGAPVLFGFSRAAEVSPEAADESKETASVPVGLFGSFIVPSGFSGRTEAWPERRMNQRMLLQRSLLGR